MPRLKEHKSTKIALVTGGNRGLGYETCKKLAQLGLKVLLGAGDMNKGKSAAYQLNKKEGLDVKFYQLDVSDQNSFCNVVKEVDREYGKLDILINNAAILYYTWQKAIDGCK
jgi:NAD(P)-dependent dehydrogenase (short-subunit alcohol dehydrogenase family)